MTRACLPAIMLNLLVHLYARMLVCLNSAENSTSSQFVHHVRDCESCKQHINLAFNSASTYTLSLGEMTQAINRPRDKYFIIQRYSDLLHPGAMLFRHHSHFQKNKQQEPLSSLSPFYFHIWHRDQVKIKTKQTHPSFPFPFPIPFPFAPPPPPQPETTYACANIFLSRVRLPNRSVSKTYTGFPLFIRRSISLCSLFDFFPLPHLLLP